MPTVVSDGKSDWMFKSITYSTWHLRIKCEKKEFKSERNSTLIGIRIFGLNDFFVGVLRGFVLAGFKLTSSWFYVASGQSGFEVVISDVYAVLLTDETE